MRSSLFVPVFYLIFGLQNGWVEATWMTPLAAISLVLVMAISRKLDEMSEPKKGTTPLDWEVYERYLDNAENLKDICLFEAKRRAECEKILIDNGFRLDINGEWSKTK